MTRQAILERLNAEAPGLRKKYGVRSLAVFGSMARGDDRDPADPGAIIARRDLGDGRLWGTTSVTLVGLAPDALRYDFQASPGSADGWYPVPTDLG